MNIRLNLLRAAVEFCMKFMLRYQGLDDTPANRATLMQQLNAAPSARPQQKSAL
ncbi:hypothetical protein CcrColossus_gp149 [Caulobacter phage CcrColossus]|uniref:Uncharacterized protein n=1 Tax=Caulobacter phage CcrColossus TaxID=1211640 RepID=K4JRR8_9CAUD|nr:hypothetical protein CcrColossus_gp149 [Caulobacter phage CcrColossus]AFU88019.1 hypothetical protein CcrColossus_gp149 [Caulobacter phage CcrColossus]